jgi:hypothetical protein
VTPGALRIRPADSLAPARARRTGHKVATAPAATSVRSFVTWLPGVTNLVCCLAFGSGPEGTRIEHQHAPRLVAPSKVRLLPKVVRADAAAIKTPIKAKARVTVARVDAPVSKHPTKLKAPGETTVRCSRD